MWKSIIIRLVLLFGLWLGLLFLPWWLMLLLALAVAWWQNWYWEILCLAAWYDLVYGPITNWWGWPLPITLVCFLVVNLLEFAKQYLVLYRQPF